MGRMRTAAKIAGVVTGIAPAVDLVRTTGEAVGGSASHVAGMGKAAFKAATTLPEPLPEVPETMAAEDRFWTYLAKFGNGPKQLPALRRQSFRSAYAHAFGAVGLFALLVYSPMTMGDGPFFNLVRVIVPAALFMSATKHAFANWLYRRQAHGSFGDFLRSGDWLPRR